MSIFTRPAIWRLVTSRMQRHVRECMEFKGFEREGGALFVFTMKHNSKHTRVEVTIKEKILEHLSDIQVSDIILRRMCQKFEERGINIPLNEQVAMDETTSLKILQKICTELEGTNIHVIIKENSRKGVVFEFHDLGEDLYVDTLVPKEMMENTALDVVVSAIFIHMRWELKSKGVNIPTLKGSDEIVVHDVVSLSNVTKSNIKGFGDWG